MKYIKNFLRRIVLVPLFILSIALFFVCIPVAFVVSLFIESPYSYEFSPTGSPVTDWVLEDVIGGLQDLW